MAQNTNSINKETDISSSVLISSHYAQDMLSRYLEDQQADRLKNYHKYLKQKTDVSNFTSFSICPLLHSFDISDFKVSSQRNASNAQQTHNIAAAACRRKCNSASIKYFNYGEKSTFQHGISASEALEEYRRTNVYSRSRLYKSNQDALEISMLLKSDIQRIIGSSRVNETFVKPLTISAVTPKVPPIDGCADSLQEKANKRKPKEKAVLPFRHKHSKERPAVQLSVVSLDVDATSQIKQNSHSKLKHTASLKDIGPRPEIGVKNNSQQSACDADILNFVHKEYRNKQKNQSSAKQRRSLCVSSNMPTAAEESEIAKAMKIYQYEIE